MPDTSVLASWMRSLPSLAAFLRATCWFTPDRGWDRRHQGWLEEYCCRSNDADAAHAKGCFSADYPYELCCGAYKAMDFGEGDASESLEFHDVPTNTDTPWESDDACDAIWEVSNGDTGVMHWFDGANVTTPLTTSPFAQNQEFISNTPCHGRQRFVWDGFSIRSISGSAFYVADASRCAWRVCTEFKDLRFKLIQAGSSFEPYSTASVYIACSDGPCSYWEPIIISAPASSKQRKLHSRSPDRPSVYMLVLDSVSRIALRRLMPKTYEFLQREGAEERGSTVPPSTPPEAKNHESIHFSRFHTAQWGGTLPQLLPMFYGGLQSGCAPPTSTGYNLTAALRHCLLFEKSVLAELRDSGYRIAFSSSHSAVIDILRNIRWSDACPFLAHLVTTLDGCIDQACIGGERYWDYIMRWNSQYLSSSEDSPLLLYSHFNARHFGTSSIEAMDLRLRDHLVETLDQHPGMMLFVMSDHGVVSKVCDQRSPFLHLFVPQSLLATLPDIKDALVGNKDVLTSPWDLFLTLLHLSSFPDVETDYVQPFARLKGKGIQKIQTNWPSFHQAVNEIRLNSNFAPHSLFQKLPSRRGCRSAGIAQSNCGVNLDQQLGQVDCVHVDTLSTRSLAAEHLNLPLRRALCKIVQDDIMPPTMLQLNYLHADDTTNSCKDLNFHEMVSFTVYKNLWSIRFIVHEGDPPRVFDAHFHLQPETKVMNDMTWVQVTRYQKYKACTPEGIHPVVCVCDVKS